MSPRLPLRPIGCRNPLAKQHAITEKKRPICLFCSLSPQPTTHHKTARRLRARNSKNNGGRGALQPIPISPFSTTRGTDSLRAELEEALVNLQKHAPNYVNLSRIQLALNGLRQQRGHESIRVAILGVKDGPGEGNTAKEVLRLLLADPLKPEEDWEKEIEGHDLSQPLIVRVGPEKPRETSFTRGSLLHEVNVSSAVLNGHNVELLLMDTNPPINRREQDTVEAFEDAALVPTVDIPTSNTGRYTPITTPVHKALFVAAGFRGAASLASNPALEKSTVVTAAVNLPTYKPDEVEAATLPFTTVDVATAGAGLKIVREDLRAAIEFEHLWFRSNIPKLVEWLKLDTLATTDDTTKPPVKILIASVLANASLAVDRDLDVRSGQVSSTSPASIRKLRSNLEIWAEGAHGELQQELDLAFSSQRWRRLRWWKLFWRVDDVGMFTTDIITQRFLKAAEKKSIFLAGQMHEAGIHSGPVTSPKPQESTTPDAAQSLEGEPTTTKPATSRWPVNIATTRNYLQAETIPALQALAQKLVMQTLSTSGLTSSLGALVYFGTLTTTVYEAGAVAALGIVWSMKRMQKQWETARDFWEGEVREEGRKAVRNTENEFSRSLTDHETGSKSGPEGAGKPAELTRAKDLVDKAWRAYEKLK